MNKNPQDYERKKCLAALFYLILEGVLLTSLLVSGLSLSFKSIAGSFSGNFYFQLSVYWLLFFLYLFIFDSLFSLYSQYYLEHAYGLSNQTLWGWAVELFKRSLLSLGITLPLLAGLYALIRRFPGQWWIWAWLGFGGVSYLLGQLFPVLIVPLFYRYSKVESPLLRDKIFRLVQRFNLPLENVYSLNLSKTTKKANAMFAGLGRTKRLILSDTLIQNFTNEEIESVVAHELGHFKHRDIWYHLIFSFILSFIGFAVAFTLFRRLSFRFGFEGMSDLAALPLLILIFYFFSAFLTPLNNVFSRWREREADRFALKAVGAGGFVPAMEKLAAINLANPHPHPLIVWWFYTHPPIEKRIRMAQSFVACFFVGLLLAMPSLGFAKEDESEEGRARKAMEERSRTQVLSYFYGNPKDASGLEASISIDLYNQAVEFYNKREFELAKEALKDSLQHDPKNPFAYELVGDIAYFEQNLDVAEKNYESALKFRTRKDLEEKILKVRKEKKIEGGLVSYREEHFLIKYGGEERGLEGFELREFLRNSYREVGQDLGYFFRHKVVVLLYDDGEFRKLSGVPHWSSGIYDGKIRLPAYQRGFSPKEIQKIMRHELTHAFISEISNGRCPAWLNEGLAEYEESKVEPADLRVFDAAVRSHTLFPLPALLDQKQLLDIKDPLEVALFYVQAYKLVSYLVERYGMFQIKKMLQLFAQGKDSLEAIEGVLKISPMQLEKEWIASFSG